MSGKPKGCDPCSYPECGCAYSQDDNRRAGRRPVAALATPPHNDPRRTDAMSDDISEIVRQLRTGEAIDRTAIAATLERLSAGKEEAFQWADKFKARAEAAEARLHAMSDEIERLRDAITLAANRLDIAVAGNHGDGLPCRNCVEIALSYLRPSEG